MKTIKIRLEGEDHSAGRGVGFYRSHLLSSLEELDGLEVVKNSPDLVHYPFFDLFYPTLPQKLEYPTVVTIHDLTPLVLPKHYPMGVRARFGLMRQKTALKNVSAIITDSLSSKKDILGLMKIDPEKVFVTYLAAAKEYFLKPNERQIKEVGERYHLPEKFILYVGGVNPNKNLVKLANAAIKLHLPVVLVGPEFTKNPVETFSIKKILGIRPIHSEVKEFVNLKKIIENNPLFHILGFVGNSELNAIYHLASLYCQPSLYEGFGLPVLEAMTAGCLVVCSNRGSLPEIYPWETICFDPENQKEIEEALEKGLSLKKADRDSLIEAGKEKAAEFSWEKTAKATKGVYLSVLNYK